MYIIPWLKSAFKHNCHRWLWYMMRYATTTTTNCKPHFELTKTPDASPSMTSYGMSIARIWDKLYRVTTARRCIDSGGWFFSRNFISHKQYVQTQLQLSVSMQILNRSACLKPALTISSFTCAYISGGPLNYESHRKTIGDASLSMDKLYYTQWRWSNPKGCR